MGRPGSLTIRLKDGSGKVTLKYLTQETDRYGNVRTYFRKEGKRVRIRSEIGTDAFLAEYRSLYAGELSVLAKPKARTPESLSWLVAQYYASPEFKVQLSVRTQYVRRGLLERICADHGSKPYARMEPRHVRDMRDSKSHVPGTANAIVKALRQLFDWAKNARGLARNPAKEVPYIEVGGEGFHSWSLQEVEQYKRKFPVGTMPRLAFDILLFTGVRRSDAVRLGPTMEIENGSAIRFVVTKGKRRLHKELVLPIVPSLRRSIDATKTGKETYIIGVQGRAFTVESFGNWFRDRCNEAGLPHCSAHGLRKAGATLAAEGGASAHQLKAIFGWETITQAEGYTKRADQARLAKSGMHLLDRGHGTETD